VCENLVILKLKASIRVMEVHSEWKNILLSTQTFNQIESGGRSLSG